MKKSLIHLTLFSLLIFCLGVNMHSAEYRTLPDAIKAAENLILKKYTTPRSQKEADKELDKIIENTQLQTKQKIDKLKDFIKQHSDIPFHNVLDCDGDGIPDKNDSNKIIATYNNLTWDVNSISLGWDIERSFKSSNQTNTTESKSFLKNTTFSWGGDAKIDTSARMNVHTGAGASAKYEVTPNPLKLFGATGSKLSGYVNAGFDSKFSCGFALTGKVDWNRQNQDTARKCYESLNSVLKETSIKNLHLIFTVTFYNTSDEPLEFIPKPIPILIGGTTIVNAEITTTESVVVIPEYTFQGVEKMFRANLNTTNALKLITFMQESSPTIMLEKSSIRIVSKHSKINLISSKTIIDAKTIPVSVKTLGGAVTWRVARTHNNKRTTIQEALTAINQVMKNYDSKSFISIKDSMIKKIAGYEGDGLWLPILDGIIRLNNQKLLSSILPEKGLEFELLEKKDLSADIEHYSRLSENEKYIFCSSSKRKWTEGANLKWPEGEYLFGICYLNGYSCKKNKEQAIQFLERSSKQGFKKAVDKLNEIN